MDDAQVRAFAEALGGTPKEPPPHIANLVRTLTPGRLHLFNTSPGIHAFFTERVRQTAEEGFSPTDDLKYSDGQLLAAARCYARAAAYALSRGEAMPLWTLSTAVESMTVTWPWSDDWWKPSSDPKECLRKAGALLAAEYDRLLLLEMTDASDS